MYKYEEALKECAESGGGYAKSGGSEMFSNAIRFREQKYGYDKEQVDSYIKELSAAYNAMYEEYTRINQNDEAIKNKADVIGNVLLRAEMLARQTIDDASRESTCIVEEAKERVSTLLSVIETEKSKADMLFQIMDEAKTNVGILFEVIKDTKASINRIFQEQPDAETK